MKAVAQEDLAGCAVACAAFVLGITYGKALKLFDSKGAGKSGYYCREIVEALGRAGKKYSFAYVKPGKRMLLKRPMCIVFVKKSGKYPLGHYLARAGCGLWMNPWVNFPKIKGVKAGFQKSLPGKAQYVVYPE